MGGVENMSNTYIELTNQIIYYIIYVGAVIIPPLFWLWYFRYQDKERPEPLGLLSIVFLLGFSFCILRFLAENGVVSLVKIWLYGKENLFSFSVLFLLSFAAIEELGKFLILRYYAFYRSAFDERIDGIIYGITVGLGFATCENILNIMSSGLEVTVSRFATATLLHAVLGGFIGYFLSIKKFTFRIVWIWSFLVFIFVSVLHFIYNLFSSHELVGSNIYGEVIWVFVLFSILVLMIIDTHKRSKTRRP